MIPAWKIHRELKRIGQQLKGFGELLTDPIKQHRLDKLVAAGLPCIEGAQPLTSRVVLLLIYQPDGIANSVLETCRWFSDAGWTPFVISNAPIRTKDQNRLAEAAWRVVTRPNFGYDFGGYRDGLTCLRQWGVDPEELIILNDSIWLPVVPDTDFFELLGMHPAGIVGFTIETRRQGTLLESFFLRLRSPALRHPAIRSFWLKLRLTSNKFYVVRRGEKGINKALQQTGVEIGDIYGGNQFLIDMISRQDDKFIRETLQYAAYFDADLEHERKSLLAETSMVWRDHALTHINKVATRRQAYRSFPYAMIKITGCPILKKSSDQSSKIWRHMYLKAIKSGGLPLPSIEIQDEINKRDTWC